MEIIFRLVFAARELMKMFGSKSEVWALNLNGCGWG